MKQFFIHYERWEDYNAGMYTTRRPNNQHVIFSYNLLRDSEKFYVAGKNMITDWPISTKVNLTNPSINKKAWIGQASCFYIHGSTEEETILAWWMMREEERTNANNVALNIIEEWKNTYLLSIQKYEQTTLGI